MIPGTVCPKRGLLRANGEPVADLHDMSPSEIYRVGAQKHNRRKWMCKRDLLFTDSHSDYVSRERLRLDLT